MVLELDGDGPRYAQITRAIMSSIEDGLLAPGTRVPGTRELARALGCSRNIVLLAYEQLALEGYLVGRSKKGTFVSPDLPRPGQARRPAHAAAPRLASSLSRRGRRLATFAAEARLITLGVRGMRIDFMYGNCEPDEQLAVRLRAGFAKALRLHAFGYIDPAGDAGLRAQVAERLRGARGIVRSPEQIVITSGAQQALDLCSRLLVGEGDRVIVEEPGYAAARASFEAAGGVIVPVRVDRDGLDVAALPQDNRSIRLVYVTPSHQFPTGAVMSAARRHALLAWAARRGACVLEDDYDGELRYAGRPIKALAAQDGADHVIYCGTFSKSMFPSLRLGYLAFPEWLARDGVSAKWLTDRGSSALMQFPVRELMASGEYDRHIRRMHRRYASRRSALVQALRTYLGSEVVIAGDGAGLHLVAWTPRLDAAQVDAVVAAAQRRGIGVYSITPHAVHALPVQGLMLGYGLVDVDRIHEGIDGLAAAFREVTGTTRLRPSRTRENSRARA
jgi:GntR family transcriptional regulator / MocR family aminotransferase